MAETLILPIGECDLHDFAELVKHGTEFSWTFSTEDGNAIDVKFVQEQTGEDDD